MWFSEKDIPQIQRRQKLPFKTAQFLWQKTEHSVPTIQLAKPKKGMRILELGCGVGGFTLAYLLRYAAIDFEMTAIDFSPVSVEITRSRLSEFGFEKRCKVLEADMLSLPFKDHSFDMVICPSVLEHLPQQDQALSEMSRVCKINGRVIISTDNKKAFISRISFWTFTNAFSNLLKYLKILRRPKGFFIANHPQEFEKKLIHAGLSPQHLSYTEFGFPGFRSLIGLIRIFPFMESILLPLMRLIEKKSSQIKNGCCHSVFLSDSQKK